MSDIQLRRIDKTDKDLLRFMEIHYSRPKGFVGRQLIYKIIGNGLCFGAIAGGSATLHLKQRFDFWPLYVPPLETIVCNTFYHLERWIDYPCRNFATKVISLFRKVVSIDWRSEYQSNVLGFETLIEPPRTGECYRRDGWRCVGMTEGFQCKRVAGYGSDGWSGKREWNLNDRVPKHVFMRLA